MDSVEGLSLIGGAKETHGSYMPVTGSFAFGAPANEADGKSPSEPGITELSSLRLPSHQLLHPVIMSHQYHSHIAKHVFGQNHSIQLPRIGNHDHGRRVHELMIQLQLGILLGQSIRHDLPPQPRSSHHVRLIDRVNRERRVCGEGDLSCDAGDTLYFGDGVDCCVPCNPFRARLLSLPKVCTTTQSAVLM